MHELEIWERISHYNQPRSTTDILRTSCTFFVPYIRYLFDFQHLINSVLGNNKKLF